MDQEQNMAEPTAPISPVSTSNRERRRSSQAIRAPLSGKIALVTGATGGIGMAVSRTLASLGCSVAIHYNSDQDTAIELLEEFKETYTHDFHSKFVAYKADLANYDEVRELHEHVVDIIGPPNILINNAGANAGLSNVSSADDVSIDAFEQTWRINCGSAYLLTQLCLPAMEGEGWGRVIFVSSVAALTGGIVGPHYASSKSALHGLIHWLAQKYAKKGITVNGIAPALIEQTKMLPGSSEELDKLIPVGRLGLPQEVTQTVIWMIQTGYLTNKIIGLDGGMFPH